MNCRRVRKDDRDELAGIHVQWLMVIFCAWGFTLLDKDDQEKGSGGRWGCWGCQVHVCISLFFLTHIHTHTPKIFPLAFNSCNSFNPTGRESTTSSFKNYKYFKCYKIYCKNVHSVVLWGTGPAKIFSGKLTCALFCPLLDSGGESRGSRLMAWTKQGGLNSHGILNTSLSCSFSSPGLGL